MTNELFNVVFDGVANGQDVTQVKVAFSQLFGMDADKTERLFATTQTNLKKSVDADAADNLIARLAAIGVEASKHVQASKPAEPAAFEVQPADAAIESNDYSRSPSAEVSAPVAAAATMATESESEINNSEQVSTLPFVFTGKGFEYFKIWIVNILLSIVTLGIYSAWAKVRNNQYFYGNTYIDTTSFEYTAEPIKILKGRVLALGLFIAYSVATKMSPILAFALAIIMMVFLPWIIVTSLRFNARHSSYRNINFRFVGTVVGAFKVFILWPIAALLSLGILLPVAWKKQVAYTTSNHLYGDEPFVFDVSVKEYYKLMLVLLAAVVAFCVVIGLLVGSSLTGFATKDPAMIVQALFTMLPAFVAYLVFYFFLSAYFTSRMANIHFNNTHIAAHRFNADWSVMSYGLLLLTNTLGVLFTLGLFIPFAKVRTAAYKAAHTKMTVQGNLDNFVAAEQERSNSLGEGVHDIFDIDISL